MINFLIVGQGIGGSVLTARLKDFGKSVYVIDKLNPNASSQVAAGLVNPITGRRIVKSWMADTALPIAFDFYKKAEEKFGQRFFHSVDALELVGSVHELNEWTRRADEQDLQHYFSQESFEEASYRPCLKDFKKLMRITQSGWMNMPAYTKAIRESLISESAFSNEVFDYSQLKIHSDCIEYYGIEAEKIIFCEGYQCQNSPYWKEVPMLPAKGEIMTIECPSMPEDFIVLSGMFIIPIGNKRFRCGATYEWKFSDELPSAGGKVKLIDLLNENIKVPYTIIEHTAGVRPTVKDRRPVIGAHPTTDRVLIFNGLGTKGVMLSPLFSLQMAEWLEGKTQLNPEVNVNRFLKMR